MSANNCSIARKTFYFLLEVTNVLLTMETFPRNGAKNVFLQMCVLYISHFCVKRTSLMVTHQRQIGLL